MCFPGVVHSTYKHIPGGWGGGMDACMHVLRGDCATWSDSIFIQEASTDKKPDTRHKKSPLERLVRVIQMISKTILLSPTLVCLSRLVHTEDIGLSEI